MAKRRKLPAKKSEKLFSNTAGSSHIHPKNSLTSSGGSLAMRGGIRL